MEVEMRKITPVDEPVMHVKVAYFRKLAKEINQLNSDNWLHDYEPDPEDNDFPEKYPMLFSILENHL
jgi:hypothetical protein